MAAIKRLPGNRSTNTSTYDDHHALRRTGKLITSNPANDLCGALTRPPKNHYPALQLEKLPELLEKIESYPGRLKTRLAVQLTLLIFVRSSEVRFARWSEIDLDNAMRTLPANREPITGVHDSESGAK